MTADRRRLDDRTDRTARPVRAGLRTRRARPAAGWPDAAGGSLALLPHRVRALALEVDLPRAPPQTEACAPSGARHRTAATARPAPATAQRAVRGRWSPPLPSTALGGAAPRRTAQRPGLPEVPVRRGQLAGPRERALAGHPRSGARAGVPGVHPTVPGPTRRPAPIPTGTQVQTQMGAQTQMRTQTRMRAQTRTQTCDLARVRAPQEPRGGAPSRVR